MIWLQTLDSQNRYFFIYKKPRASDSFFTKKATLRPSCFLFEHFLGKKKTNILIVKKKKGRITEIKSLKIARHG